MEENNSQQKYEQKQEQIEQPPIIQSQDNLQQHQFDQQVLQLTNCLPSSKQQDSLQYEQIQQGQLSRKFTRTPQGTDAKNQLSELLQNNLSSNLQQSSSMASFVVQSIITHILQKFQSFVDLLQKIGQIAIKQTFSVLINNPNLGISNGHILLEQHIKSILIQDNQPKPSAYIDGSIGHIKIKQIKKQPCSYPHIKHSISSTLTQKQKQKKRISKYSSFYKKNSMVEDCPLPLILERYHSMMPEFKNQLPMEHKQSHHKKQKNNKNMTIPGKMEPVSLIDLDLRTLEIEDNFINYLRFAKVQAEKYWSMNSTQRNQFINQYSPDIQISTLKNSRNPIKPKQASRRNSLSNIQLNVDNQLNLNLNSSSRNKTRKAIPANYNTVDNINQQTIMPVVMAACMKKSKNYQVYVSVHERQQAFNNVYSYDGQFIKETSKNVRQTKKLLQIQSKKNISNTSFHYNPIKKQKQHIQLVKSSNKRPKPQQQQNQGIRLPKITIRNKKQVSRTHDEQLSVWLKNRQKNKQFQNKFNQFINTSISPSTSISQLKTIFKQQHPKQCTHNQTLKQNSKITNKPLPNTSNKISKRGKKSIESIQIDCDKSLY